MATCSGMVRSLNGLVVTFSGRIELDGIRTTHEDCGALIRSHGASWSDDFGALTDLVVSGLQDDLNYEGSGRSRKVMLARRSNGPSSRRPHVHMIQESGLSQLLNGRSTKCLNNP